MCVLTGLLMAHAAMGVAKKKPPAGEHSQGSSDRTSVLDAQVTPLLQTEMHEVWSRVGVLEEHVSELQAELSSLRKGLALL